MSQKRSTSYRGAKPATKLAYREMTNLSEISSAFAGRDAGAPNRSILYALTLTPTHCIRKY